MSEEEKKKEKRRKRHHSLQNLWLRIGHGLLLNKPSGDLKYRSSVGALRDPRKPVALRICRASELAVGDKSSKRNFTVSEIREVRTSLKTSPETSKTNC